MSKFMKKLLCASMAVIMVFSTAFCLSLNTFAAYEGNVPVIFIHGQGSDIGIKQEDGTYKPVAFKIDKTAVINKALDNKNIFFKAFLTQDWTDFCDLVVDIMSDAFSECVLDITTGEPTDGSESTFNPTEADVLKAYKKNKGLETFAFNYDWRLDPLENMEKLEQYIELVLKVTESEKYAICARCEGACMALQYLEYYKTNHDGGYDERLTDIVMYSSAALGCSPIGESFSGQMVVDPEALERFFYDNDFGIDKKLVGDISFTDDALREIITIVSNAYGIDLGCWAVNNVYEQIYMSIIPRALSNSYASFPGYWAMVSDEYYDAAKETIFGGREEDCKVFIDKIDRYHYNIMNKSEQILTDAINNGIEVSNIVKYGFALYPMSEESNQQSDKICTVSKAGWGVSSTELGKTFDDEYIKTAEKNGTSKYISPDKTVDASTTFLKDTTWFVKNLAHKSFPAAVDPMVFAIVNAENGTVDTVKGYSQYMYYDEQNNVVKAFNASTDTTRLDKYYNDVPTQFFRKIKPAFKYLFKLTTLIINFLMPKVKS